MRIVLREITRGVAGGVGFLVAWIGLGMPWWLAGTLGLGLYIGVSFLVPAAQRQAGSISVAPGISAREHNEFITQCGACATALKQIAGQLAAGHFRVRIEALAQNTAELTKYCQRKPESILAALAVPRNLDHLLRMLRQYIELSQIPSPGPTVAEVLQKVEETVGTAALALEGIYKQLLDNDVAALEASTTALEYLLGADSDLDRARRNESGERIPRVSRPVPSRSTSSQKQMENPK